MKRELKISGYIILVFVFLFLIGLLYSKSSCVRCVLSKKDMYLQSFFENRAEYETSFEGNEDVNKTKVAAGVVSHHFLARDLISKFFSGIDPQGIKNVIIIGPDHYGELSKSNVVAVSSGLPWKTPFGNVDVNRNIVCKFEEDSALEIMDKVFLNEHSIYTLVPFVRYYFPKAKIVPVILAGSMDYKYFYNLGKRFYSDKNILIVSSDFSHNVTLADAIDDDAKSIEVLSITNLNRIDEIECDCRQCIAFLYGFISEVNSEFVLLENTNSSYYGDTSESNLTSYISAYYRKF